MPKLHVHIGHHFFGSGNLGDDLMLAGFLEAARPAFLERARLTCCTPFDREGQGQRFPEVEWLPYDNATRAETIRRCDVWLGLGDTPFQATGGHTWFLDHLCGEAAWCLPAGVPMFYLGVGVNEREVVNYPQTRDLLAVADRVWTRDEDSATWLAPLARPDQMTAHADLAHLALATMQFPPPVPGTLGIVLNFEDPSQYDLEGLATMVRTVPAREIRWLAQEVRPLTGAETFLHEGLPPAERARAPLRVPDYAGATSARALLADWEGLNALFVSRYHASLIGAWMGVRTVVFARSDKVAGAIHQLGLGTVPNTRDPAAIVRALETAIPTERAPLRALAERACAACEEFFAAVDAL